LAHRILVVDDEPMVCALVSRALTDEGYQVTAASDGQVALAIARAANPEFNLIVTNSWIPGLSGSELIARLRQDFPKIPILHIDDLSRHKSGEFHHDVTMLYKPFSVGALRKAVGDLLAGGGEEDGDYGEGATSSANAGS
jgi:two-component system, cell cycle sensor histidine kinase and response regulator CckA